MMARPSPRTIRPAVLVPVAVLALVIVIVSRTVGPSLPSWQTVPVIPYWNLGPGTQSVVTHREESTMVSPWLYAVDDAGDVVPAQPTAQPTAPAATAPAATAPATARASASSSAPSLPPEVLADLDRLEATGLPVVPTVSNGYNGAFQRHPIAEIIADPQRRSAHVEALTALARTHGFAGIGIDYEELTAADREPFSRFVTELGAALHAEGRVLAVDVFAKTDDAGYDERNRAQDLAAIGRAADQVRVMAYDLHWSTSAPGPVAPVDWVAEVLRYARRVVPAGRLVVGLPWYGYDWSGGVGRPVSWQDAERLAAQPGAVRQWDDASAANRLTYTDPAGGAHEVWFEDGRSLAAKVAVIRRAGADGVFLWMFGPEDPGSWSPLAGLAGKPVPRREG